MNKGNSVDSSQRLYSEFTGHSGDDVYTVEVPEIPNSCAVIGSLVGVIYDTVRDGNNERYIHEFDTQPILCIDDEGTQLIIVGGNFKFTERGIEG